MNLYREWSSVSGVLAGQIGPKNTTEMNECASSHSEIQQPLSVSPVIIDKLPPILRGWIDPDCPVGKAEKKNVK